MSRADNITIMAAAEVYQCRIAVLDAYGPLEAVNPYVYSPHSLQNIPYNIGLTIHVVNYLNIHYNSLQRIYE